MKQARFTGVSFAASSIAGLTTVSAGLTAKPETHARKTHVSMLSWPHLSQRSGRGGASVRSVGWGAGWGISLRGFLRVCPFGQRAAESFAINNAAVSRHRPYGRVFTVPGDDQEKFRAGDIIVTAVARQYVIGRVRADGQIQDALKWAADWSDALATAFGIAGPHRRVFVFQDPSSNEYRRCLRETESPAAKPLMKSTTGIPREFTTRGSWRYHTSRKGRDAD
jgi:hypothetical protein